MSTGPTVETLGDAAAIVWTSDHHEARPLYARLCDAPPAGVEDVVLGARSVTLLADPHTTDALTLVAEIRSLVAEGCASSALGGSRRTDRMLDPVADTAAPGRRRVELPVAFDGEDLALVAAAVDEDVDALVTALTSAELEVAFLGFAPGFAYLVGLPDPLAALARRAVPRERVPAGAVALGGGFAGVYPVSMPGGWHLVGHTDVELFDPERDPPALLAPGDRVRFVPAEVGLVPELRGWQAGARAPLGASGRNRRAVVVDGGLHTTVQDRGRRGVAGLGVPRAGALDADAARVANRLVGNPPDAAVLEATRRGPVLRFEASAHVALVGDAPLVVNGRLLPAGVTVAVEPGGIVALGTLNSGRTAYLAVDGGFDTPSVLGSRSSDSLVGLGPGPLRAGDELAIGDPVGRPRARATEQPSAPTDGDDPVEVQVLPGPHAATLLELVLRGLWRVEAASDRVGLRLSRAAASPDPTTPNGPTTPNALTGDVAGIGARMEAMPAGDRAARLRTSQVFDTQVRRPSPSGALLGRSIHPPSRWDDQQIARSVDEAWFTGGPSFGVPTGAIQVPSHGTLVALLADHPTVGGYAVPAVVASVDVGRLGQLLPGALVRFVLTEHHGAIARLRATQARLDRAVVGSHPATTSWLA
jgi:KipI family sensor histidine kinase inhibitor